MLPPAGNLGLEPAGRNEKCALPTKKWIQTVRPDCDDEATYLKEYRVCLAAISPCYSAPREQPTREQPEESIRSAQSEGWFEVSV